MSVTSSRESSPQPSNSDGTAHSAERSSDREDSQSASRSGQEVDTTTKEEGVEAPPVPSEDAPPLPTGAPPGQAEDDGWAPVWDDRAKAFYFFNSLTNISQWDNPRVPDVAQPGPPGVGQDNRSGETKLGAPPPKLATGGYDPSIHGDYDPNADYAKVDQNPAYDEVTPAAPGTDPAQAYAATGAFNRFTGKWQNSDINPERFNDENKSRRQMNAFFDVDAAANSHDGKSLKAERSGKKLSKKEVKAFKDKRREKKEEKRRAWLRD